MSRASTAQECSNTAWTLSSKVKRLCLISKKKERKYIITYLQSAIHWQLFSFLPTLAIKDTLIQFIRVAPWFTVLQCVEDVFPHALVCSFCSKHSVLCRSMSTIKQSAASRHAANAPIAACGRARTRKRTRSSPAALQQNGLLSFEQLRLLHHQRCGHSYSCTPCLCNSTCNPPPLHRHTIASGAARCEFARREMREHSACVCWGAIHLSVGLLYGSLSTYSVWKCTSLFVTLSYVSQVFVLPGDNRRERERERERKIPTTRKRSQTKRKRSQQNERDPKQNGRYLNKSRKRERERSQENETYLEYLADRTQQNGKEAYKRDGRTVPDTRNRTGAPSPTMSQSRVTYNII